MRTQKRRGKRLARPAAGNQTGSNWGPGNAGSCAARPRLP